MKCQIISSSYKFFFCHRHTMEPDSWGKPPLSLSQGLSLSCFDYIVSMQKFDELLSSASSEGGDLLLTSRYYCLY